MDRQQTLWLNVSLWGKRAESGLVSHLKKGKQIFVSGELTLSEYKANDGTTRINLDLNANIIELVGKKDDTNQSAPSHSSSAQQDAPAQQPSASHDNFDEPDDEKQYRNTRPRDDEMRNLYRGLSTGNGDDVYLSDGMWLSSDGSIKDLGR
jgi:single-strand DNA-binding protein